MIKRGRNGGGRSDRVRIGSGASAAKEPKSVGDSPAYPCLDVVHLLQRAYLSDNLGSQGGALLLGEGLEEANDMGN
jgi:hypothetical protein